MVKLAYTQPCVLPAQLLDQFHNGILVDLLAPSYAPLFIESLAAQAHPGTKDRYGDPFLSPFQTVFYRLFSSFFLNASTSWTPNSSHATSNHDS